MRGSDGERDGGSEEVGEGAIAIEERAIEDAMSERDRSASRRGPIRSQKPHSSLNFVGTREVEATSSFDAVTYFTIVGMCPFVSLSRPCIIPFVGSSSPRMTVFQSA